MRSSAKVIIFASISSPRAVGWTINHKPPSARSFSVGFSIHDWLKPINCSCTSSHSLKSFTRSTIGFSNANRSLSLEIDSSTRSTASQASNKSTINGRSNSPLYLYIDVFWLTNYSWSNSIATWDWSSLLILSGDLLVLDCAKLTS